ncbi:MAG TPA: hypothetical protein VJ761_03305 [Ktedonobacteraceae bacterium]|nr:hypothetical protein [Ktedonobacteraceae bacterium]
MVSATECLYIYQQLALMLQELGMDDVVKSVEEEWTTLDAITGEEQLLVEGADSLLSHTSSPKKQRKSSSHKPPSHAIQAQLLIDADNGRQQSPFGRDSARVPLSEQLYPPRRRVLLLINAIEHALAQPALQGLAVMDMLKQDELRFEDPHQHEQAFTLSRATLQQHEPDARALLKSLRALYQAIDPTGEQEV